MVEWVLTLGWGLDLLTILTSLTFRRNSNVYRAEKQALFIVSTSVSFLLRARRSFFLNRACQIYGALKRSAKKAKGGAKLGTIEAAALGAGASLAAQAVTTPLDVVRTRVMTASTDDEGYEGEGNKVLARSIIHIERHVRDT